MPYLHSQQLSRGTYITVTILPPLTSGMMEDSDILTLGWGCEAPPPPHLWHPGGEEFVTLEAINQSIKRLFNYLSIYQ